jgi:nucleotide-binding universal stress UspA family protein
MYQTIVVGTDGSETAGVALHHAIELAKATGATVHVVNAYRPMSTSSLASSAMSGGPTFDLEAVNGGLENESAVICSRAAGQAEKAKVKCETHVIPGDPSTVLIDLAEQINADLIVIGNRGMTGVRRMLGSVPNKVSHHAPCSLLIVDTAAG